MVCLNIEAGVLLLDLVDCILCCMVRYILIEFESKALRRFLLFLCVWARGVAGRSTYLELFYLGSGDV